MFRHSTDSFGTTKNVNNTTTGALQLLGTTPLSAADGAPDVVTINVAFGDRATAPGGAHHGQASTPRRSTPTCSSYSPTRTN